MYRYCRFYSLKNSIWSACNCISSLPLIEVNHEVDYSDHLLQIPPLVNVLSHYLDLTLVMIYLRTMSQVRQKKYNVNYNYYLIMILVIINIIIQLQLFRLVKWQRGEGPRVVPEETVVQDVSLSHMLIPS